MEHPAPTDQSYLNHSESEAKDLVTTIVAFVDFITYLRANKLLLEKKGNKEDGLEYS